MHVPAAFIPIVIFAVLSGLIGVAVYFAKTQRGVNNSDLISEHDPPFNEDNESITHRPSHPMRFNILAFGDSLTAGFHHDTLSNTINFHPYSTQLNQSVLSYIRSLSDIDVVTHIETIGLSGWTSAQLQKRLDSVDLTQFDVVVILAGTNDLGRLVSNRAKDLDLTERIEPTVEIILAMHAKCRAAMVRTVVVTLPQIDYAQHISLTQTSLMEQCRVAINQRLRAEALGSTLHMVTLADLDQLLPVGMFAMWDDAVHFSPAGYDYMGDKVIFPAVRLLLDQMSLEYVQ